MVAPPGQSIHNDSLFGQCNVGLGFVQSDETFIGRAFVEGNAGSLDDGADVQDVLHPAEVFLNPQTAPPVAYPR